MANRLDDLLRSLPGPSVDHALDQLEPAVWRRIEARSSAAVRVTAAGGLPLQLVAAGMALAVGLALGWSMNARRDAADSQSLYASYAEVGPIARLENGL